MFFNFFDGFFYERVYSHSKNDFFFYNFFCFTFFSIFSSFHFLLLNLIISVLGWVRCGSMPCSDQEIAKNFVPEREIDWDSNPCHTSHFICFVCLHDLTIFSGELVQINKHSIFVSITGPIKIYYSTAELRQ